MKWECISMDFVTGLPKAIGNYDSIFIIVDKLTKVARLIPVKQTATAADIAQVFIKEIVRLHGTPARIISDWDAKFTSKFWQAMFQSLGTQSNLSTAYHPETEGQTKRVNQECLVPLRLSDPTLHIPAVKSTLETMDQQLLIIRDNLKRASDRQKSYADLHRSARSFSKDEWVFPRVKPKRSSLKLGKFCKLAFRYCEPFEILRRAGEKAYELSLPLHMRIHNVFHINLLKKYVFVPLHILNHDDAILINQEELQMEPEQVLEVRKRKLRHRTLREVLVTWKGYTVEDASWENWDDLVAHCSHFG
ncbi:hypothetical protein L7F22_026339 [Adiantum nelumboides]|nr:hypothetical protein [Adiantum nelumboides]